MFTIVLDNLRSSKSNTTLSIPSSFQNIFGVLKNTNPSKKQQDLELVVYNCFLRKLFQQRCTDVTSFYMQFEKRGRRLLQEAFESEGEYVVCLQQMGEKEKYLLPVDKNKRRRPNYKLLIGLANRPLLVKCYVNKKVKSPG